MDTHNSGSDRPSTKQGALHSNEELFSLLIDCAVEYAIYVLDENGIIRGWNGGAERIYRHRAADIVGRDCALLFDTDAAAGRPDRQLAIARQAGRVDREDWRMRGDGSRFLAHDTCVALWNEQSKADGFAVVTRDLSARQGFEDRFRQVVEGMPNAIVMSSRSGSIEMVNAQAEKVFGYQRSEMLGKSIEMLVPERFSRAHPSLRGAFFADPRSRPMGAGRDLYGLRKDGSEFPVEIGLNPIPTDQGTMVLSAIVDISDRKQKEQKIEASLREKEILLAEIHHRVKNNLQIVNSLLHLQAGRVDDPQISAMLRDSQNRVHSMALIHQTLYQSNDFSAVNFTVVLERLIPNLAASYCLNPRLIDFEINADEVRLPLNQAIPCGLIVNELIANALKHGFSGVRPGKIGVTLSLDAVSQRVNLEISDDGIGLPENFNSDSTATLGLQLVTLLVDQLDGELTMHRANPTRFIINFPFHDARDEPMQK